MILETKTILLSKPKGKLPDDVFWALSYDQGKELFTAQVTGIYATPFELYCSTTKADCDAMKTQLGLIPKP